MGNFPNQCDPSDPERHLACCWLKKIVTRIFLIVILFLFRSSMLVSSGGILGMVTPCGHWLALYINYMYNRMILIKDAESGTINAWTLGVAKFNKSEES